MSNFKAEEPIPLNNLSPSKAEEGDELDIDEEAKYEDLENLAFDPMKRNQVIQEMTPEERK
jgi:hypothetical protein